jgi:hypothetical protein
MKFTIAAGVLTLGLGWATPARAQEAASVKAAECPRGPVLATRTSVARDDDGGRVQIVPLLPEAPHSLRYHCGPLLLKPRIVPVLLGAAWQHADQQERIATLSRGLEALTRTGDFRELEEYGVAAAAVPVLSPVEVTGLTTEAQVSDLEIQHHLDQLISRSGPTVSAGETLYVVFVGPLTTSLLGNKVGGSEYLAYHNHFHGSRGVVRYVVASHQDSLEQMMGAVHSSVMNAILNPEGDGWY